MSVTSLPAKIFRHSYSILISLFITQDSQKSFLEEYRAALSLYQARKSSFDYNEFLMPSWKKNTDEIESFFEKKFSFSFLRNPILKSTMFAHLPTAAKRIQKKLILEHFGYDKAKLLLKEHSVGSPILNDWQFLSSGNTIHHLYHLAKFEHESKQSLSTIKSACELGGGYGNMARLAKALNPEMTYTIIDIPVFSFIQLVYLKTTLGTASTVLYDETTGIIPGKINIVPISRTSITNMAKVYRPDVFFSTWAISESNKATQNLIKDLEYFKANFLFIAYQKVNESFAFSEQVTALPEKYKNIYQAETSYLTDNYYLIAQRKHEITD
ncbi:MAG: putative sugar O-methyltransferase [Candidatus Paceibacterota bacterium]